MMSIEKNIERIADALEQIAALQQELVANPRVVVAPIAEAPEPEKPKPANKPKPKPKPKPEPEPEPEPEEETGEYTLDDVRKAFTKAAGINQTAPKRILQALGAARLSELDPDKFEKAIEMAGEVD